MLSADYILKEYWLYQKNSFEAVIDRDNGQWIHHMH